MNQAFSVCIALMIGSGSAAAADFDARVAAAKAITVSKNGQTYDAALGPFIGKAMQSCIPPGSSSPSNLGNFSLVASVSSEGLQSQIEVKPQTVVSACFGKEFGALKLPPPPKALLKNGSVPIVVEMKVVD